MRCRLLRNSGLRVAEISLGTMTFREEWEWGTAKEGTSGGVGRGERGDLGFPQELYAM